MTIYKYPNSGLGAYTWDHSWKYLDIYCYNGKGRTFHLFSYIDFEILSQVVSFVHRKWAVNFALFSLLHCRAQIELIITVELGDNA